MNKPSAKIGVAQAGSAMLVPADHPENVLSADPTEQADRAAQAEAKAGFEYYVKQNPGVVRRFLDSQLGRTYRTKEAGSGS